MCIQQLRRIEFSSLGLLVSLIIAWQPVMGLATDKEQPIEIEADSAELDEIKNISIYRGNVIVKRGSITMTGDKMTVYSTENDEMDPLIMEGRPATYRQLPDDSDIYDEAEALTIEYYELKNLTILIEEALVTQEGLRFSGKRIEYDTLRSQIKAWSKPKDPTGSAKTKTGERVKITIKKKKKNETDPQNQQ